MSIRISLTLFSSVSDCNVIIDSPEPEKDSELIPSLRETDEDSPKVCSFQHMQWIKLYQDKSGGQSVLPQPW